MMVEESGQLLLRIKSLNEETFDVEVSTELNILGLKGVIHDKTEIEETRQRLIYKGRLLQNHQTIQFYAVQNGHTIHLITKPSSSSQNTTRQLPHLPAFSSPPPSAPNPTSEETVVQQLINSGDHIQQGLYSCQTILSSLLYPSSSAASTTATAEVQEEEEEEKTQETVFHVGQWLDVKDTVNQWLEATVLQVSATQVLIHYHGWPSRWDEWIDKSSNRLETFRSRTVGNRSAPASNNTPFSPFPHHYTSTNDQQEQQELLPQIQHLLQETLPFITNDNISTLIPLFDRIGRVLTDTARHLSSTNTNDEEQVGDGRFRQLIQESRSNNSVVMRPQRSIDVHIHAILAPVSNTQAVLDQVHRQSANTRASTVLALAERLGRRRNSFHQEPQRHQQDNRDQQQLTQPLLHQHNSTDENGNREVHQRLPENENNNEGFAMPELQQQEQQELQDEGGSGGITNFLGIIRRTLSSMRSSHTDQQDANNNISRRNSSSFSDIDDTVE